MSSIDEYIDWSKLWFSEELKSTEDVEEEYQETWAQFLNDEEVSLDASECSYDKNTQLLIFVFSETGGQNESDTVGWSRDYHVAFHEYDLCFHSVEYQQG